MSESAPEDESATTQDQAQDHAEEHLPPDPAPLDAEEDDGSGSTSGAG